MPPGFLPSRSILISFFCIILSLLSWFSISSFLAFPSLSSVLIPQPILAAFFFLVNSYLYHS